MARGYIAGGMTGIELEGWPAFEAAAIKWRAAGWDIVTPTEIDEAVGMVDVERSTTFGAIMSVTLRGTITWEQILKIDLAVIDTCDAIILLPGWEKSRGARRELAHALSLGLEVHLA